MPQQFLVRVRDTDGGLVVALAGTKDGYAYFSYTRRVRTVGAFVIGLTKGADEELDHYLERVSPLQTLDGTVEFLWRWPEMDIDWHSDGVFLIRSWSSYLSVDGAYSHETLGRGLLDLLGRRRIWAYTDTPEGTKTGPAESIVKAWVNEQAGPGAGARAIPGLSVEADGGNGPEQTVSIAYLNLLESIQDIAETGEGDFSVEMIGPAQWEFRWYPGQQGADRRGEIFFSVNRGNMREPTLAETHHDEINAVLEGGQGEGLEREVIWRTDPVRIASSPINRVETFRDARQAATTAELEADGDAMLEQGRPKNTLTFEAVQSPGYLLGRDYFLGDVVTAEFMGIRSVKRIRGYTYSWSGDSQSVAIEMEDIDDAT